MKALSCSFIYFSFFYKNNKKKKQVQKLIDWVLSYRRYANDAEIGSVPLMPGAGHRYGAPVFVVHRWDLQRTLASAAKNAGCEIMTLKRVVSVDDSFAPHVTTSDGCCYQGDVVLAGDGIRSCIRGQMATTTATPAPAATTTIHAESDDGLVPSGDAAYRLLIPREEMERHESTRRLISENTAMRWIGPGGHIMGYPLRHNSMYNLVLMHPAKKPPSHQTHENGEKTQLPPPLQNTTQATKRIEMLDCYQGWSPVVQRLLSYAPGGGGGGEIVEWTLFHHPPLRRWVRNRIALMGDACHPMLPYTAQGASNAIEDAGALIAVFGRTDDVALALGVYQEARKDRAERMQGAASAVQECLHLHDGRAQRERDRAIRSATTANELEKPLPNPDLWVDRGWQDFMWGLDIMEEIAEQWEELVMKVRKGLTN